MTPLLRETWLSVSGREGTATHRGTSIDILHHTPHQTYQTRLYSIHLSDCVITLFHSTTSIDAIERKILLLLLQLKGTTKLHFIIHGDFNQTP